jgi:hypothetical protein
MIGRHTEQEQALDQGGPADAYPSDFQLLRTELARMTDTQLSRFLGWLDQRGAPLGKVFAVHQADPRDPRSRDLVEFQMTDLGRPQTPRKVHLTTPTTQHQRLDQTPARLTGWGAHPGAG